MKPIYTTGSIPWKEIAEGRSFTIRFRLEEAGFADITLTARSASDWRIPNRESSVLCLTLQGEYNQDMILFYGDKPFEYRRLLGHLEPGEYELTLAFNRTISSPEVERAFIERLDIGLITRDSDLYPVYRHAPILYGRNVYHPHESRYTDTPLLMFYLMEQDGNRTVYEYQIIFSHEDEGTPTPLLMSKWGRTTDIEWVYRVVLDSKGYTQEATFQGPKHITGNFTGRYAMGGHPVLQVATCNGMVHDKVTSDYRQLLPPIRLWNPSAEPRERVMDDYPYTYQVSAWEMARQYGLERPVIANSFALADLRHYLFVQSAKYPDHDDALVTTAVDIQVKLKGLDCWFSGSYGDLRYGNFRCTYDGPYSQFSTAVKLPPGTGLERIEQICAVWLPAEAERVMVPELKAFFLNDDYIPQPAVFAMKPVTISSSEPRAVLWQMEGA